jgi:formiminotetrahydrofolate cyclodeaminase
LLEHIETKNNELKDAEMVSKESFKIYEGFLICDRDRLDEIENALRKIIEKDPQAFRKSTELVL